MEHYTEIQAKTKPVITKILKVVTGLWLGLLLMTAFWGYSLWGATESRLHAENVADAPKIDGDLNDLIWQQAELFTDFKMVKPNTNAEPSEKTELRVLYDSKNLYIGIFCYVSDPAGVVVNDMTHDQNNNDSDLVRILLDPFQDKRNAYAFFVNPKGARTDGLANGGERFSTNWDGIWDAKTKIQTNGWSAEIKIPFKTISFNPRLTQWGFNVERYLARRLEVIRLSGISKDSFFYNPAEAALLGGIKDVKQGLGITFKPYAALNLKQTSDEIENGRWEMTGGFDLYKNFSPNLVGVFTFQTDFAETEADDRVINLTRFSLYYPEKRSFFLEGSDIFQFEGGSGMFSPSFVPFFSRRIGLYDSEPVPILWGAKIFGKVGNTNMALLNVRTKAHNDEGGRNFFAGRIYQNIFSQGKVGLIFTSGQPGSNAVNTLMGVDFKYATARFMKSKNIAFSGWWVLNNNDLTSGNKQGYGFKFEYPNDLLDMSLTYNYLGDGLQPGLGFVSRTGIREVHFSLQYRPRPNKGFVGKLLRQIFLRTFLDFYWDLEGQLQSNRLSFCPFTYIKTESGDELEFYVIPQKDLLLDPFEVSDGVVIAPGDYQFTRYQYHIKTARHRMVSFKLEYETGGFYSGNLDKLKLETAFNFKGNFRLGLETQSVKANLLEGQFKEKLYRAKADFHLTPDLGLSTYFQYDSVSENIGTNIRFKWRISPGNTIYLVYNKNWERRYDPVTRFYPLEGLGIFKLQFSWRP